jgi:uncharacterized protein YfbU (UPF0304 family)
MLVNQYLILERLYPEKTREYQEAREAVECGYELHYSWISPRIDDDVVSPEECKEVLDILEMFSILNRSYDRLSDKSGIDAFRLNFRGFDGNNEPKQMGFARYFCTSGGGRHTELALGEGRDAFNSHSPVLNMYRRMLLEWRMSENPYDPTRDEIIRIAAAAAYPGV